MRTLFEPKKRRDAQTLVFFLLAWGTIMLLCGLAIDSGLLYLAKARLARAVDGASLAAVGNFNRDPNPATNRDDVAAIMRNFAVANFTALSTIGATGSSTSGGISSTYAMPSGGTGTIYTYNFNDGTQDANGQYRRFVQVILNTGSTGTILSATCNARCPVSTFFIGYATYAINGRQNVKIGGYSGPSSLVDLKVSSSAVASRSPRLIMVVVDRSASMLQPGGGAFGLPQAVVTFLDFFDTGSDNIGIVSFSTSARLEMPLTTNFIVAGTNLLFNAYQNGSEASADYPSETYGIPGADPEEFSSNADYDANYATTGVRRLKFGGQTAADEGIRLALEQMMANSGFYNPSVVKDMVIFTDGKWNSMRTLVAAPGYTNVVSCPAAGNGNVIYVTNAAASGMTNGQSPGPWSTNLVNNTNLVPVPTLSPLPYVTNAITTNNSVYDFAILATNHLNDVWQSVDTSGYEPLSSPTTTATVGAPMTVTTNTWVAPGSPSPKNYYAYNLDVWLQPGAVDYLYHSGAISNNGTSTPGVYVSNYNNPTNHINIHLNTGDSNVLVVPGYVVDGLLYDGIDLPYPDNPGYAAAGYAVSGYPRFRSDNYNEPLMWPDDGTPVATAGEINSYSTTVSLMRDLMFRNYANLLTGYYVNRPDEPLSTQTEPLDDTTPATYRPLNGLGPYYPSAPFYWPFDMVGIDFDPTYQMTNATENPDLSNPYYGYSCHSTYSINMSSTNAAPNWYGELFYKSISGNGTNTISGSTSASQLMVSSDWRNGAPAFVTTFAGITGLLTNEPTHDTNIVGSPSVWRPLSFNGVGASVAIGSVTPSGSATGGYVSDGNGHIYANAMAWSGRPTHYYDFSQAQWIPVANNHVKNTQTLNICNWKAQEYAWHARALGVTIYTVGYGQLVSPAQQVLLAQIANSTNTTAGNPMTWNGSQVTSYTPGPGTAISYNPSQPIGQQFYATNSTDMSNDFYQVGVAINEALTQ